MNLHEMKSQKMSLRYSCEMISRFSGVSLETVQKIFEDGEPLRDFETWQALNDFFEQPVHSNYVREGTAAYNRKSQGEYTLDDYYRIPDDIRVELIDGVIYNMAAPTSIHQLISELVCSKLLVHVTSRKGRCIPFIAPVDVQLNRDEKTMVQPDVLIVCDRDKVINRCVYGAPDFVMEVLSPSSRYKDMNIKLHKYMSAGVREYWIVDPDRESILVHDLEHSQVPVIYGFDDMVPVHIWNGECKIDFRKVYEFIQFLYEKEN